MEIYQRYGCLVCDAYVIRDTYVSGLEGFDLPDFSILRFSASEFTTSPWFDSIVVSLDRASAGSDPCNGDLTHDARSPRSLVVSA